VDEIQKKGAMSMPQRLRHYRGIFDAGYFD
jgi:hypothetical protein